MGYEPIVVTGPGETFGRFRPNDPSLAALDGVEVRRIPGPEPVRSEGRLQRLDPRRNAWEKWLEDGMVAVGRQVEDVDLIYADMGPDATAFAGARLARELDCPWIPDLGDPWALDEMRVYLTAVHRRVDMAGMRRALRSASAVVMNTKEASLALREAFAEHREHPVPALPVGYDAADFHDLEHVPNGETFRIVHTGSFHTQIALAHGRTANIRRLLRGGPVQPVDVLTRSPYYLRQALDRLASSHPDLRARIELHLAGGLTDADRSVLEGLTDVVDHGFLTHRETLELITSADMLFLPMQELPRGHRGRMVPCKGYEYLASGRPILAALPEGDGRDVFSRAAATYTVWPSDPQAMADAIVAESQRPDRHLSAVPARADVLAPLEREHLNTELVHTFDTVLGSASGAPSLATAA
jgi:glycosyltransferase involved in cell wall biosynthesis